MSAARQRHYPETGDELDQRHEIAVLVGVERPGADWPIEESLAELERLAHTAGASVVGTVTQKLDRPNPRTFIGPGKAEEVAELARATGATAVLIDDDLTPSQQVNLEGLMPQVKLIDRTQVILDIFAMHAVSREGKLQVELAQLEYLLPRLRGMWAHLDRERLGGGRGARFGAGESQLEVDRRLARKRISELRKELKAVSKERALQRSRRAESGVLRVSLVGYTNAGKSTLLNSLTSADVLAEDMLFATLDSTTRKLSLPEGRQVTITDTVGFIHKLPHGLVEAFKSTLDEVGEADLLLHVIDGAHEQAEAQMQAVDDVLHEIDAHRTTKALVVNKADMMSEEAHAALSRRHPDAIFVSALRRTGLDELMERIAREASRTSRTVSVKIPYTRGDLVTLAHERAHIVSEQHDEAGTTLILRAPEDIIARFNEFLLEEGVEQ